jgi:predicted Zn finger-like uncharacterized protein
MIIECPYCSTRFRLDEKRLSTARPMLKCSRCQHIFPAPERAAGRPQEAPPPAPPVDEVAEPTDARAPVEAPPAPAARPAGTRAGAPPPAENLAFTFADESDDWDAGSSDEPHVLQEQFSFAASPHPAQPEPRPVPKRAGVRRGVEAEEEADDETEAPRGAAISVRPVFLFLLLVVVAYGVLAGALKNNPEWAAELADTLPFIGGGNHDRLLNRKVTLLNIDGGYERIREGKTIFVVTGEIANHAAVALSTVQVLARILDDHGAVIDERTIFCGNAIPLKLLKELSLGEVSIVGRLKPPKSLLVRPGDTSPFVVVFTDLPAPVAEFTAQVVSVQRHA